MNKVPVRSMKKYTKTIAGVMAVFALLLSLIAIPSTTAMAITQLDSQFGFDTDFNFDLNLDFSDTPDYFNDGTADTNTSGEVVVESETSFTECVLEASSNLVTIGESITLNWRTSGFDTLSINGNPVSGDSGSVLISNIRENTTFTLEALSNNGSKCVTRVVIECLPPPTPTFCELEVTKQVNKQTAVPGELITYTITVKNTGDADCTGGGVLIEDKVDPQLTYISHQLTSNFSAGYGSKSVYTSSDRTLRFNGNVLTPGESGTITWVGKVNTPTQCGDFEVKNQAKATAKELNNFTSWSYSQIVKTNIDNDCVTPPTPLCTLTPELQTIPYGGTATLSWTTTYADTVTLTNFGSVTLQGSKTTGALFSDTTYVLVATGEGGEVRCEAKVLVGEPAEEFATVIVHKIVCDDESELPNYGNGSPNMTAQTASSWVNTHASCSFESGWEFEWTDSQTSIPGDDLVGKAGYAWNTFGPTDASGRTSTTINLGDLTNSQVWFREVLQNDYIPFTYSLNGNTNSDNVSAEFYCHTDVINYDNRDFIKNMQDGETYYCVAWNSPIPTVPAPSCDVFTATPNTIMVGGTSTLVWETSNAVEVFINNGIGLVSVDGNIQVSPLSNVVYVLTAVGVTGETATCEVPVTVSSDSVPVCEYFTATPNQLAVGGGNVTLDWKVLDARYATITPLLGSVPLTGTGVVSITESTTFTLTAVDGDGDEVSCLAPVTVADPQPALTCANNVVFNASDTSIRRGESTTLSWSTTDVDSVSISGVNASTLSGSAVVSPSSNTTYTLVATRGSESVSCPLSISVSTGGGGGGITPRCELEISDDRITRGERITLSWETSGATEITLTDDRGDVIFTTDDYLSDEKEDYFDGSVVLAPTRDTEYTLLVERGSRDRECSVEVEVEDSLVVLQSRDQQPLVAGISLSQVPYTGFEAGAFLTALFYTLLIAWSLYITYLLVIHKRTVTTNGFTDHTPTTEDASNVAVSAPVDTTERSIMSESSNISTGNVVPENLPVSQPIVGYGNQPTANIEALAHQVTDDVVTSLENRAHEQKALLSSDAVRYFVGTTAGDVERNDVLDTVISEAKKIYPLEDGWVVINESRMRNLCTACKVDDVTSNKAPYIPTTIPTGSGSLAEAIVTGNVVAAYEMIGKRPMFALADAASDLDSVYRHRRGETVTVSDLLIAETNRFSDEQIKNMISALTSALDGTYTDEASAVKMAIMKAVKEVK